MGLLIGTTSGSGGRKPGTPTSVSASAGIQQATVTFTAPSYLGKPSTNNLFTVTSSPGSITATGASSPITVTGLTAGTAYTFTVNLRTRTSDDSVISIGDNSAASDSVTPTAPPPFFPPFFPFFPGFGPFFPPFFPFFPFFPPSFAPSAFCIDSQTLVSIVGLGNSVETKKAEDLVVGDTVWAPTYTEYTDENDQSIEDWEAEMLTNMTKVQSTVVNSVPYVKPTLYLNNDESTRMSFEQVILVKPVNGNWQYSQVSEANIGDTMMKYNPGLDLFEATVITNITEDEGDRVVYGISVEETDTFIAGNVVVHNK